MDQTLEIVKYLTEEEVDVSVDYLIQIDSSFNIYFKRRGVDKTGNRPRTYSTLTWTEYYRGRLRDPSAWKKTRNNSQVPHRESFHRLDKSPSFRI